jgi:MATE family, multidrug efflux pump
MPIADHFGLLARWAPLAGANLLLALTKAMIFHRRSARIIVGDPGGA